VVLSQEELNALLGSVNSPSPPPPSPPPATPQATAPKAATPPPVTPFANGKATPTPASGGGSGGGGWTPTAAASFDPGDGDDEEGIPRGDLEYLAKKADDSLRSIAATPMNLPTEVIEFQFPEFGGTVPSTEHATLDQISEVDLDVKVELGRTYMYIEDVLKLRRGSVVALDKTAGETVDIYINGRLLARGEVLVMNENFCVRVAELLAGAIPME
jgi:flagellar motor switch protein FliN/FliY